MCWKFDMCWKFVYSSLHYFQLLLRIPISLSSHQSCDFAFILIFLFSCWSPKPFHSASDYCNVDISHKKMVHLGTKIWCYACSMMFAPRECYLEMTSESTVPWLASSKGEYQSLGFYWKGIVFTNLVLRDINFVQFSICAYKTQLQCVIGIYFLARSAFCFPLSHFDPC